MVDVAKVVTNDKLGIHTVDIVCGCDFLWSLAHQFCYSRLSDQTGENEYHFVNLFSARAKRIAATYARFYLETEAGGDPAKRGRHYWMALGAFASKTVACLLDSCQLQSSYAVGTTPIDLEDIAIGLARGNLWLFYDIAPSHWLYNNYGDEFDRGMACHEKRNSLELETGVRKPMDAMPWAAEAEEKLNYFKPSEDIIEGFQATRLIEESGGKEKISVHQVDNLMAMARHEQGAVLQPLIYDDPDFTYWTKLERSAQEYIRQIDPKYQKYISWMAPKYQIVFTHECETDDSGLKSVAPDEMIVEDYRSRMDWIEDVADLFHDLMTDQKKYMIDELNTIADWVNEPDATLVY